ncbi:MAG TPA: c-type cytochrome [Thermoanaerobaculia bacterium]|jgi:mono/diheme cytochrome c family protein
MCRSKNPRSALLRGALIGLLLVTPLVLASAAALADDQRSDELVLRAARGRTSYRIYCQNCHGKEAKGDGPIAELLKAPPADLTKLAADNDGKFPVETVSATIDGRNEVAAHGSREMPIWGFSFQDPGRDEDQEAEVAERIRDLVAYLQSIQAKGDSG